MKTKILSAIFAVITLMIASISYAGDNTSPKSDKGYVVHSVVDGRHTMTAYNKKGKWIYTIQQYSQDNLDKTIIDKVRAVYYDYGVTGIQKIEQPGTDTVYVVRLENTKSIKLVRLTDTEMELVQDLVKG